MSQVSELREGVETTREQMTYTARQLEARIGELKDWRTFVREYPLASLGLSIGTGLLLTGALKPLASSASSALHSTVDATLNEAGTVVKSTALAFLMDLIQSKTAK